MKKFFIFLLFISFLRADFTLSGYIHVGDNDDFAGYIPKEPITFNGEHTYKYYLNYPTNFYLSNDSYISKIELIDAKGIETDDKIKIYIDGNLAGKGEAGSNVISIDKNLKAGFHTIALEGECYNKNGKNISCKSKRVEDIDDFYVKGYKFYTLTSNIAFNFIQRHHIGDNQDNRDDWYDDLSDNDNKPFWYPDDYESDEISYDFNVSCSVSSIDFYIFRIRDVSFDDTDKVELYINGNLAGAAYINTPDDGVYNLHFIYDQKVKGPFTAKFKIISGIDDYDELDDFSWDELVIIPTCMETRNSTFNAVDYIGLDKCSAVGDWDDNITTKLANDDFNLTILSKNPDTNENIEANITKVDLYIYQKAVNGKCDGEYKVVNICTDCGKTNENGCMELDNIKYANAAKCVVVHIEGKAIQNSSDVNESNSTDNFAIRPFKFEIIKPSGKIKAGSEFNITLKAFDKEGNPVKDYNESVYIRGESADIEYNDTNSSCYTGELSKISGKFSDGVANVTLKYSEVGDLNLTIKEVNGSEFAKIDSDDTSENQRFIQSTSDVLTFIPHHFDVNITIFNYDRDKNFTYLDKNLSIYALIDLNITAKNEQNETTTNYNKACYAKNSEVNISYDFYVGDEEVNRSVKNLLYTYYDGDEDKNESVEVKNPVELNLTKDVFTNDNNGSAEVKVEFNFDRNISNPVSPFEYNITDVNVSDIDGVREKNVNIDKNALFYYGRLFTKDVDTFDDEVETNSTFGVYDSNDTNLIDSKDIVINWYENVNHQGIDGNISKDEIVISKDYNASNEISGVEVESVEINSGILSIKIKRTDSSVNFAVIHLLGKSLSHLWYSKFGNPYNISKDSTCLNHFCISVTWHENEAGVVGSGEFKGTESNVSETNSTKTGVKIFR